MDDTPNVLDPAQLIRIESTHRGYLYQHLYAVACLLVAAKNGVSSVQVELDEDVEIVYPDRRLYIQVKTRSGSLQPNQIQGAIERFDRLREEHEAGRREGEAAFLIVSNVAPSELLNERFTSPSWPADIGLRWPGHISDSYGALPPGWLDLVKAVEWCVEVAGSIPLLILKPETLVWKLAGRVLLASSDAPTNNNHSFLVDELPSLFEQLAIQLQDFPAPPPNYRPQTDEPGLVSEQRTRIISGFSGAGKTAWASQMALFASDMVAYLDVGDVPGSVIAVSLARELAARLFGKQNGGLGEILLPGATGAEMLHALDVRVGRDEQDVTVVIDNAHSAPSDDLRRLVVSTRHIRFVFLCQPGKVTQELEIFLGITREQLSGWSADTVAAEAKVCNCRVDAPVCYRLLALTGGLPLYIQSALRVAETIYGGDVAQFCSDLDDQTHTVETAQETILNRVFEGAPSQTQDAVAVLSLSDCPLDKQEVITILYEALGLPEKVSTGIIRSLVPIGVSQAFGINQLKIHDAIRMIGRSHLETLGAEVTQNAQIALKDVLVASLHRERDMARIHLLIRTLVNIGDIKTLVDMATDEFFHELGVARELWDVLDVAAQSEDLNADLRFWALDGLIFADMKEGNGEKVPERLEAMSQLIERNGLGITERLAFTMKQMLFEAVRGEVDNVFSCMTAGVNLLPDNAAHSRIFRYNCAHALFELETYAQVEQIAGSLIDEYYEVLGLRPQDVVMKNPDQISPNIKRTDQTNDDLKHLADSLDLCARAVNGQEHDAGFARIHAMKFYTMAGALDSFLKVGQDLVDEFVGRSDYVGARQLLENNIIPTALQNNMTGRIVPIRSQYAVILAYCGDFDSADAELERLLPYEPGLDELGQLEFRNQRQLIDSLREHRLQNGMVRPQRKIKIGRNSPCPCGSGKKYKKCHGANN